MERHPRRPVFEKKIVGDGILAKHVEYFVRDGVLAKHAEYFVGDGILDVPYRTK